MNLLIIIILTSIAVIARMFPQWQHLYFEDNATLILGLLILSSYVIGKYSKRFLSIPMLSGFILYGILAGPQMLNIIRSKDINSLEFVDFIALALIAITAGGELRWNEIKRHLKLYSLITAGQFLLIFSGMALFVLLIHNYIPLLRNLDTMNLLIITGIIGIIAVANSPATAIAVIKELDARGPNTDLLLGVAVFKDIIIILVFAMFMAMSSSFIESSHQISLLQTGFEIILHLGASVLIGVLLGSLLIASIRYLEHDLPVLILLLAVFVYISVHLLQLEAMLTAMVAGFVVQNFSRHGDTLIRTVEKSSLPFYIIFFTIAGARIDFNALLQSWLLAIVIVLLRIVLMALSTRTSIRLGHGAENTRSYLWMGYLSQAGVSLGLITIVKQTLSTVWAPDLTTTLVAVIAFNQILGPIALKWSLDKLAESNA